MSEEDFLNLIGRAGRFRSELYGNVICLKGDFENSYKYKYFISQQVSSLTSEIISKTRGNFYKDIKQIIQGKKPVSKNLEEDHKKYSIRQQYANIAILHNKVHYNSKLRTNLITVNNDPNLFKYIEKNQSSVDKLVNFKEYTAIPISFQQYIYSNIDEDVLDRYSDFECQNLSYSDIEFLTEKIMEIYRFHNRGLVKYEKSYLYYAHLLYDWINGTTIAILIKNTIKSIESGKLLFLLDEYYEDGHRRFRPYNGTKFQINLIINDILEKLETDIKHTLKLYFSNYIYLNIQNGSMSKDMEKIIDFIEFGTRNYKTVELQKFGFSRELSVVLLNKYSDCIHFVETELESIDFNKLFNVFNKSDVLFEELKEYEYLI